MTNFKVGQKVVCIDNKPTSFSTRHGMILPQKGKVYIVRGIVQNQGLTGILLEEITNNPHPVTKRELAYALSRFRSLEFNGDATKEILEKFAPVEEKIDTQIPVEAQI